MSWRGGAVSSRSRDKARTAAPSNQLPGYQVWRGRTLLHARHLGRPANARAEHRPYHVVARTMQELVAAVQRGDFERGPGRRDGRPVHAWLDVVPTEWNLYRLGSGSEEFKQREATAEALAQQMRDLQDTSETTGGTSG